MNTSLQDIYNHALLVALRILPNTASYGYIYIYITGLSSDPPLSLTFSGFNGPPH